MSHLCRSAFEFTPMYEYYKIGRCRRIPHREITRSARVDRPRPRPARSIAPAAAGPARREIL
jgi:hypothetical protein